TSVGPVPHIREPETLESSFALVDREEVRDDLAWVLFVVEAVDDRDGRVRREFPHVVPPECPVHDAVYVSTQDAGRIRDRFASANLEIVRAQEERVAAELRPADLG